jgi:flagellin-like protein
MNFRKFRRNVKAISPVISVLLMIAVAVAASLVTYAWVMGYLGFTTTKVGKAIQIQSVAKDQATDLLTVYVQNVGDSDVKLASIYVNGTLISTAEIVGGSTPVAGYSLAKTNTVGIDNLPVNTGLQVTVKVVTTDGTFIEYTKTFPD